MRALLLAGGLGTRLRPLTDTVPKCLVPIGGRPLLEYWLDLLFLSSIDRVLVNTHYLPDRVNEFINHSRWRDRVDTTYEETLLGTGGTVLENSEYFQNSAFFVAHADNLSSFSFSDFHQRHLTRPQHAIITMMTFRTDTPELCGVVDENQEGIVTGFYEKASNPPSNLSNAAVYIFEPEVLDVLASMRSKVIDISLDLIPQCLGRIATFHNATYHRDIGNLRSLTLGNIEFPQVKKNVETKSK